MSFIDLLSSTYPRLMSGLALTLYMTVVSLALAMLLGMFTGLMSVSKNRLLNAIAMVYVDIIRGTPLLVQAFFIYFGLPQALGIRLDAVTAGILTLTLNAGAYIAEIFRGGIQAINPGQMEAARSLGMPYGRSMAKVILPQALRVMIPMLINQFIITLKDTSILSAIGLPELTQMGKIIIAVNFESTKMWLIVGLFYLIPITLLSRLSKYIEGRLDYGESQYNVPAQKLPST